MKKETGLMFKAPLVLAILSGQKTQTRRIIKNQPFDVSWSKRDHEIGYVTGRASQGDEADGLAAYTKHGGGTWCAKSPVGQPGDRIYVREAHAHHPHFPQMTFRADGEEFEDADGFLWEPKWTPAIHMKKEEARIWLEITGVRVERLQQITEADCIAEGAPGGHGSIPGYPYSATPLEHFRHIWKSTGGDWDANPWVWVIDFKTISTTGRPA